MACSKRTTLAGTRRTAWALAERQRFLFGQGNFILPADTGTVDSYLGLVIYPSGGAKRSLRSRDSPLLPVANSTTFSVDLR